MKQSACIHYIVLFSTFIIVASVSHEENGSQVTTPQVQVPLIQCPPWFLYNATTSQCECYSDSSINEALKCTDKEVLLKIGYCTTYEEGEGVSVSSCNYLRPSLYTVTEDNYIRLPDNVSELNDYVCGPLNRKGKLCSECVDGFGPSIFTIIPILCSDCTNAWYGIPLYLFLEFVPITIFYFIVLFFRISVTSAPMVVFVFFSQIGVSTLIVVTNRYISDTSLSFHFLNTLTTFYGIWNLDFFCHIFPPFCVSPNIKAIHITLLYNVSAFYPLCLIVLTGLCIKLHSNNYRMIVWLWNKLKKCSCFGRLTSSRDAKNTIIDVFATFILLSYAKLLFTCVRLLTVEVAYTLNNSSLETSLLVRSDISIGYFSREHLPFALVSMVILLFAILPLTLLLTLYPLRAVRSLLLDCGKSHTVALNMFVEKFYSCYRDGLDGGRDMRSFVSVYFILRLIYFVSSQFAWLVVVIVLFTIFSVLIGLAQPYKKAYMNILDTLILLDIAMIALATDKITEQETSDTFTVLYLLAASILSSLPLLGLIGFLVCKIICMLRKRMSYAFKQKKGRNVEVVQQEDLRDDEDYQLPHRVLHPQQY